MIADAVHEVAVRDRWAAACMGGLLAFSSYTDHHSTALSGRLLKRCNSGGRSDD